MGATVGFAKATQTAVIVGVGVLHIPAGPPETGAVVITAEGKMGLAGFTDMDGPAVLGAQNPEAPGPGVSVHVDSMVGTPQHDPVAGNPGIPEQVLVGFK